MRIHKTLGRFVRLWARICEDLQGFGKRILEDLWDFHRTYMRTLQEDL